MRRLPLLTFAVALAGLLSAQATEDRTFRFRSAASEQDFRDLSTAALVISGLKAKSMDVSTGELSVSGPIEQIRMADWVVAELDRPVASTPPPPSNLYTLETKEPENTIRVFYPSQISTNQEFNEVLTAVRTISDIRYVYAYSSHRAVAIRGSREQLELVEWLLNELNRDSPRETYVFPRNRTEENQVRVFRFVRGDVQQFNEVQTMIRVLTDARRVYPYVGKRAIILRGTEEQVDLARWTLAQLDKDLPLPLKASSEDYAMREGDLVRLFYFDGTMTPQAFTDAGTNIRLATGIRRAFPFPSARTFAVRGTAAQITQAAGLASQ